MAKILIAGLINIETTLAVNAFPVTYEPVRYPFFGVRSTVSGVGYNVAKALRTLGHEVYFASLIGRDAGGRVVRDALAQIGVRDDLVLSELEETSASVIAYDPSGKRAIFVDLKNVQETAYPPEPLEAALRACDLAVLCNVNFTRPFLARARALGKPVATDVHTIAALDDPYNRDYMAAADILFMSDERLPMPPESWLSEVLRAFPNLRIATIGLGAQGALLAERSSGFMGRLPALSVRPVVNTIGAGDSLFSSFLHGYLEKPYDPVWALRRAMVFAGYKVGARGAADGFLEPAALDRLAGELLGQAQ